MLRDGIVVGDRETIESAVFCVADLLSDGESMRLWFFAGGVCADVVRVC